VGERTTRLAPGDSVVFYTDGVTEAGAPDRVLAPHDLAVTLRSCSDARAAETAEALRVAALDGLADEPGDDMAIVVMRVE
jgi:serine phosphatase RsbU (regulator of sigma subunit)